MNGKIMSDLISNQPRKRGRPPGRRTAIPETAVDRGGSLKDVEEDRRDLIRLTLEYAELTDYPINPDASERMRHAAARRLIAQLLTHKESRVREWFYRNSVPPYALFAMRSALSAAQLAVELRRVQSAIENADRIIPETIEHRGTVS